VNAIKNSRTRFIDLGQMDYKEAWDYQASLFDEILSIKASNRDRPENEGQPTRNYMLFVEHPHVYTLGKSGDERNLRINEGDLAALQATFYHINRGGDITYHGPGQLVGYPILDLENFFTDIHKYMRNLEEAIISTLDEYGIRAGRIKGLTGVWVDPESPTQARKICAMGVKMSRWVTMHGFGLNVNTDLSFFQNIIPCGIPDKPVTSMEKELGHKVELGEVKGRLRERLISIFEMEIE